MTKTASSETKGQLATNRKLAQRAGLRYVSDATPGIRRVKHGTGFAYLTSSKRPVRQAATIERINALRIPPAWTDVWICPSANGHLQATGRDARDRKQFRYHDRWNRLRDRSKFRRMVDFARRLPSIRRRVASDLRHEPASREAVLASIVRLLDTTAARIGNEEYARTNGSYGLTTLRDRHVTVGNGRINLQFEGKSGKRHHLEVRDRATAKVVKRARDLPGSEVFQYRDDAGEIHSVAARDVNAYLREIAGEDFTAKDFRTWIGTVLAVKALRERDTGEENTRARELGVVAAIDYVAKILGNTRAVCRKSYIHPAVIDSYLAHQLERGCRLRSRAKGARGLRAAERSVLQLLELDVA